MSKTRDRIEGMEAPLYLFKVFTDDQSKGNPAACALFSEWPQTDVL
jgi:predicted PhzF superfamily epimerase YddE/YHI9